MDYLENLGHGRVLVLVPNFKIISLVVGQWILVIPNSTFNIKFFS